MRRCRIERLGKVGRQRGPLGLRLRGLSALVALGGKITMKRSSSSASSYCSFFLSLLSPRPRTGRPNHCEIPRVNRVGRGIHSYGGTQTTASLAAEAQPIRNATAFYTECKGNRPSARESPSLCLASAALVSAVGRGWVHASYRQRLAMPSTLACPQRSVLDGVASCCFSDHWPGDL